MSRLFSIFLLNLEISVATTDLFNIFYCFATLLQNEVLIKVVSAPHEDTITVNIITIINTSSIKTFFHFPLLTVKDIPFENNCR